jgi:hypothetical protein
MGFTKTILKLIWLLFSTIMFKPVNFDASRALLLIIFI